MRQLTRRVFVKMMTLGSLAATLPVRLITSLEEPADRVMRFIVSPGQRWFLLTRPEGGSPSQLLNVTGKFSQGVQFAELAGEDFVLRGPPNNLELWVTENVAQGLEEVRVVYR